MITNSTTESIIFNNYFQRVLEDRYEKELANLSKRMARSINYRLKRHAPDVYKDGKYKAWVKLEPRVFIHQLLSRPKI